MSGGIAQLVAVGAQDAHLVGQPEISFSALPTSDTRTTERQVIQGNVSNGGMSLFRSRPTVRSRVADPQSSLTHPFTLISVSSHHG